MQTVTSKPGVPKCFRCEKQIEADHGTAWEIPVGAVLFRGGSNCGSRLYDSLYDGRGVEIIICDDCIESHQEITQEYRTPGHELARDARSREAIRALRKSGFFDHEYDEASI